MEKEKIIIADTRRPFWQLLIAAAFFTFSIYVFCIYFLNMPSSDKVHKHTAPLEVGIFSIAMGVWFCNKRGIHIKPLTKEFRATFEIGPLVFGQWKKIPNPEYISIFQQPLTNGDYIFEVNLWYNTNKHWQLYANKDHRTVFLMGFDLSEQLNIELLDATNPNDFKWIDKDEWRQRLNEETS